jgi:cysteine-rich repeat protein
MQQKNTVTRWIWLGGFAIVLSACIIEGEYLPDMPAPGSIVGAAIRIPACGDGFREAAEACDDANDQDGDGCDKNCLVEPCFVCNDDAALGRSACGPACNTLAGQYCYQGACVSCGDGIQNGAETDVDCGGGCAPCVGSQRCSGIADCKSGFCSSGVCCNEPCDGQCIRCDLPDSPGICAFIPENEVDANPAFVCNGSSACDGKGACKKLAVESCGAGIECISGKCVSGVCL